jgi:peptidoglycan/LPS O-acetylase OafA/YrhL
MEAIMGIVMGVTLCIVTVIGAYLMVVHIRKFANIERMAIIERGLDPKMFKRDKDNSPSPVLRWALLLIGAGLGLLIGYFLDEAFYMEAAAYFSMLMVFGGLGLLTAYIVEEKRRRKNEIQ